ncbi:hypothetical protein ACFYVR_14910 [Rhodococcus sp. NPDC003318]|uniref:hypothetical protein n=1 Tax=Rhodococcus sp. NPDC003318 TaxID=3364503 RepID=UPI0036D1576D
MKRTATVIGALGLTLGLSAGVATAQPAVAATEQVESIDSTGSTAVDALQRAATAEDAETAIQSAAGEIGVKALRECGLGALVGNTTDELTTKNVLVFVNAATKRIIAVINGPAAIISTAAAGCVERALVAFEVEAKTAKVGGSVAGLAFGGSLGVLFPDSLLSAGSTDSGSAEAVLTSESAGSLVASGSVDTGSLAASEPVSDALVSGALGG